MNKLLALVALPLILATLVGPWPALAQQTTVVDTGRRLAPPMPPIGRTVPQSAPERATAPPMPPFSSVPGPRLPTRKYPCLFNRFGCTASHMYVSFGDSIGNGVGAPRGYVELYEYLLQKTLGISIDQQNYSVNGMTTQDLVEALALNTPGRVMLAQAHIVTWNIGGNDWRAARTLYKQGQCGGADNQDCLRTTLTSFKHSWDHIVAIMQETKAKRPTLMRSMDLYNPHVREDLGTDSWTGDGGLSDFDVFQPYLTQANYYIASTLTAANIPFAKISEAFNNADGRLDPHDREFISAGGFHPNARGHLIIAQELFRLGTADLP